MDNWPDNPFDDDFSTVPAEAKKTVRLKEYEGLIPVDLEEVAIMYGLAYLQDYSLPADTAHFDKEKRAVVYGYPVNIKKSRYQIALAIASFICSDTSYDERGLIVSRHDIANALLMPANCLKRFVKQDADGISEKFEVEPDILFERLFYLRMKANSAGIHPNPWDWADNLHSEILEERRAARRKQLEDEYRRQEMEYYRRLNAEYYRQWEKEF